MAEQADADGSLSLVHRLLNFSDAVFAIVLTLLVLELHPPAGETAQAFWDGLAGLAPRFGAYAGTFAVVGIFWIAHMSYMRRLRVFDWPVAVFNLLLLFFIGLTPFVSATLGTHGVQVHSWLVYSAVMILASASNTALWLAVSRGKGRLIGGVTLRERIYRTLRAMSLGIAFAISLFLLYSEWRRFAPFAPALMLPIMLIAGLTFGPGRPQRA